MFSLMSLYLIKANVLMSIILLRPYITVIKARVKPLCIYLGEIMAIISKPIALKIKIIFQ